MTGHQGQLFSTDEYLAFPLEEAKQQIAAIANIADAKRALEVIDTTKQYFAELSIFASVRLGELIREAKPAAAEVAS